MTEPYLFGCRCSECGEPFASEYKYATVCVECFGKPCESAEPRYNAKPLMTGGYEITKADSPKPESDEEFVAARLELFGLGLENKVITADPSLAWVREVARQALHVGIAEGRRREREHWQSVIDDIGKGSNLIIAQREEAAAREAWDYLITLYPLSSLPAAGFDKWWKQQRGKK